MSIINDDIPADYIPQDSKKSIQQFKSRINKLTAHLLQPKPRLSGSDWANKFFYLPPENSAEPGKYDTGRMPYQREILDVMCGDQYRDIVLMTSARVGKSTCMYITSAYYMAQQPSPILWLLPTETIAKQVSTNDLEPIIRDTPVIRELVSEKFTREGGNNLLSKRYKGGNLTLVGAQNATGLHGKTIRVLLADEVDRFPEGAGKDGDVLDLAAIRTTTFQHKAKRIYASTPTVTDFSAIERKFKESDQRHFYVPCPSCGQKQLLIWENLAYKDNPTDPSYMCTHCQYGIKEHEKYEMLRNGEWIRHNPDSKIAGFFLNTLYSVNMTWAEMVTEWKSIGKNRFKLQVFMNSRLGKTFQLIEEYIGANKLGERLEIYNAEVPTKSSHCNGVGVLTCGVDIQQNRIEAYVWGFGANDELYLIDFKLFEGDTNKNQVFNDLTAFILGSRYKTMSGAEIGIRAVAIDSGFNANRVARYVRDLKELDHANRVIIAVKGDSKYSSGIIERQARFYKESGQLYFRVGTDVAKDHVATLFQNQDIGENYIHLPVAFPKVGNEERFMDKETLLQLTGEKKLYEFKNGKRVGTWKAMRDRVEALDCLVYAYAAFQMLGPEVYSKLEVLATKVAELQPEEPREPIIKEEKDTPTFKPHNTLAKGVKLHGNGFSVFKRRF